ncbi:response regulator transcription factor [Ornithinibacillus massiliensis]|uniref:Response regulator transcription factor n=1 Tax=Ornithinibacillus massiliensis TaxID=1944633 RepID=A0ABS5MAX8_9BACI|nr:response regulator transcription factor [Ornithinibacillus massiliensis]MBS3679097.1 response regulator transcription factor [Ornithinibacillus massiliensis]
MYKILIVEDDMTIARSMKKHLTSWGYEVEYITDFHDVMASFISIDPQLILLDISLPSFNGFHWCSEIRKVSKVPIIFISSASDNMNIVMAMNMGGDDFISKPFDLNVLTSKVQAMLRRTYDFTGQTNLLQHKGAIVNVSDGTLTYDNQKVDLTKNELKILQFLLESKGKTISRDALMTRLWETDSFIDDNTLTVNVTRLRKKLERVGLIDFIITKKGIGYLVE